MVYTKIVNALRATTETIIDQYAVHCFTMKCWASIFEAKLWHLSLAVTFVEAKLLHLSLAVTFVEGCCDICRGLYCHI